jgi:hypothetical protein
MYSIKNHMYSIYRYTVQHINTILALFFSIVEESIFLYNQQ